MSGFRKGDSGSPARPVSRDEDGDHAMRDASPERPSTSGSNKAPSTSKGKQRQTTPEAYVVKAVYLDFNIDFGKNPSGRRSCTLTVPGGPGKQNTYTDVELPNDDSLVQYLAAQNLTQVELVEVVPVANIGPFPNLKAAMKVLVPLLENREMVLRVSRIFNMRAREEVLDAFEEAADKKFIWQKLLRKVDTRLIQARGEDYSFTLAPMDQHSQKESCQSQ